MLRETVLVFAALVVIAAATLVNQCGSGIPFEDPEQINVSGCDKPECPLKQGTTAIIEIKLKPNRDIQSLTNSVSAAIFGVSLPFVGVDGTDACENIYNVDGNKVSCPLKAGTEYLYKNSFPVLSIYPRISVVVHYALKEGNSEVLCFEVPSKIVK